MFIQCIIGSEAEAGRMGGKYTFESNFHGSGIRHSNQRTHFIETSFHTLKYLNTF